MTPASDFSDHIIGMFTAFMPPHLNDIFREELTHLVTRIQSDALNSNAESHAASIRCCNHIALLDGAEVIINHARPNTDGAWTSHEYVEMVARWKVNKEEACKVSVSMPVKDK